MRKTTAKIISLVLVIMLLGTSNVFASEVPVNGNMTYNTENDTIQPRSLYLASATSEITNEGEGVLYIYADFKSFSGVEWGQIEINLQRRKSATSGTWSTVDTYTEEFDGADYPDGKITYAYTEFDVYGLETNYYYRLTCFHKVRTPNGFESKTTRTDGVLLTDYPVYRRAKDVK
ncbi:MAG: hypothetical protein HFG70_08780 [Hungatella sp.]|nr:hypothetical protein [Hungatella sp.]